jgi:hypothetical protein
MTTHSFYDAAAPIFIRMLNNLSACLDKAEAHTKANNINFDTLLGARLAPDMFPLMGQLQMASAFPKNAMCRIAGQTPPDFPDVEKNLADARARIARSVEIVKSVPAADFNAGVDRPVTIQVGPEMTMTFSGFDYLNMFVMPNFYFHVTTAYAILRHNGVGLGKMDFLGAPNT